MSNFNQALSEFYKVFKTNNTGLQLSRGLSTKNNIDSINRLLDSLITDKSERDKVATIQARDSATSSFTTQKNSTEALPSFNTRTPYVEVWINGILLVPNSDPSILLDTTWLNSVTANVKISNTGDVDEISNITGVGTQFSNSDLIAANLANTSNDVDLLRAVKQMDVGFQSLDLEMPMGGVLSTITGNMTLYSRTPIEFLTFLSDVGSAEDDSSGLPICKLRFGWHIARPDGQVEKVLTPYISFLITNINMTDPGKTMGCEFILSLQDAGSAVLQNSSADMGLVENYPQEQLRIILEKCLGLRLFTLDDLLLLDANAENKKIITSPELSVNYKSAQEVLDYYTRLDPSKVDIKAQQEAFIKAYSAIKNGTNGGGLSDSDIIKEVLTTNKTFFTSTQTAALRINSNTFENVINSLLNKITCRWYPTSNSTLDNEIIASQEAENQIRDLKRKFESDGLTAKEQEEFSTAKDKISSSCVLIWVPYFPKGVYTTSNNFFQASDEDVNPLSIEDGAFLLLPKVTSDYELDSISLPLIYGPGGSALPYYYGGAQNVFQRLSEASGLAQKGVARMIGEVYDINANYSGLVALMKLKYDETLSYNITGQHISSKNEIQLTKELKKKQSEQQAAKLKQALQDKIGSNKDPKEYVKAWVKKNKPRFRAIRGRFQASLAPRGLVNNVAYITSSNVSGGIMPAKRVAELSLKHRIGTFLNYPFTLGMSILGDPYLIRQGIGTFELVNYYPTIDGESFKFNPLLSGVYMPQKITHKITMGEYMTDIQAIKMPDTVKDTAKADIERLNKIASLDTTDNATAETIGKASAILDAIQNINLETFTGAVTDISNIYKLSDEQSKRFQNERKAFIDSLNKISDPIDLFVRAKVELVPYKGSPNTARQDLINNNDIKLLSKIIDEDKQLADTSKDYKAILKAKIKATYGTTNLDVLGQSQLIFGRADVNTATNTTNLENSNLTKLDTLYKQLQTSRYEDIKNALNNIAKKG